MLKTELKSQGAKGMRPELDIVIEMKNLEWYQCFK